MRREKTARESAEFTRIQKLGGIENLVNIRNPLGIARQYLANGDITADVADSHGGAGGAVYFVGHFPGYAMAAVALAANRGLLGEFAGQPDRGDHGGGVS